MPQPCASPEEKGHQGEGRSGSSGKNCGQGLASAPSFPGPWAAGSAKTALILEAEKKNISIQKGTRHTEQVIEMNLKGGGKKGAMFLVFSPNHINLTQVEVTDPLPGNSRKVHLGPIAGAAGEAAALGGYLVTYSHDGALRW